MIESDYQLICDNKNPMLQSNALPWDSLPKQKMTGSPYKIIFSILFMIVGAIPNSTWAKKNIAQVYLIQNSGWMEPFYIDPKSQFLPLIKALIEVTAEQGQEIIVTSFNQNGSIPGENSPKVLYRKTKLPNSLNTILNSINLPRRPNGAFADADFGDALRRTLLDILEREPGIIWMLTNNKNDPSNSPHVLQYTKQFYNLLRNQPGIKRVHVYPVRMPVTGRYFQESGLMIYAIAFGESANKQLQKISASTQIKRLFTLPPVRLKPLNEQALSFIPTGVATKNVYAQMKNGTLIVSLSAYEHEKIVLRGQLKNIYYPHEIRSAKISAVWYEGRDIANTIEITLFPVELSKQGPNDSVDMTISVRLPSMPSPWNPEILLQKGLFINGTMQITLSNLEIAVSREFEEKMGVIFGLKTLPEIFYPNVKISNSTTRLPLSFQVYYPAWPIFIILAVISILFIAILLIIARLNKERHFEITVDHQIYRISLKPFKKKPLVDTQGQLVTELRGSLFGKPKIIQLVSGKTIDIKQKN